MAKPQEHKETSRPGLVNRSEVPCPLTPPSLSDQGGGVFDGRRYRYADTKCSKVGLVTVDLLYVPTGFLRTEDLLTSILKRLVRLLECWTMNAVPWSLKESAKWGGEVVREFEVSMYD